MFHIIKSYLKFLLASKNEYGIHSPFVFDLVTKCFYDETNYPEYQTLKSYRDSLVADKQVINVTDFGAGSRVFDSNARQISRIAKTAGITSDRAELLFRLARYYKPRRILELGTSVGLATSALALGNPDAEIITLEGCLETSAVAGKYFDNSGFKNIRRETTRFEDFFDDMKLPNLDLIYFDGNHRKDATLDYFKTLLPTTTNDSVWIFDDIHWSDDMESAWETIKEHPSVTVTIDTFQWGIVFFRKEQQKEHFVVRC